MKSISLLILIFLCACEPRTRIIYQDVYKSVPVECPKPEKLSEPIYPVQILKPNTPPKQVAEAYVNSLRMCRTEIKIRDDLLNAYRNYKVEDTNEKSNADLQSNSK